MSVAALDGDFVTQPVGPQFEVLEGGRDEEAEDRARWTAEAMQASAYNFFGERARAAVTPREQESPSAKMMRWLEEAMQSDVNHFGN